MVAGLVAYLRASPHYTGDKSPSDIRKAISGLYSRYIDFRSVDSEFPIIWNGQDSETSCEILKRDASLAGRQVSCPIPGSGPGNGNPGTRGPSVTYRPGPDSPICTDHCGRLCSGFYCVTNPSGTAPGFEPPAPKPTTTAGNTNTNIGNSGEGFPTLPSNSETTAPPGQVCLSSTTATECNGGPRGGVCVTSTKCASFGQRPITTSKPSPNTNFISCSHRNQNPGQGIYTAYCVCDGSTFAENLNTAFTPYNSCAYTQKPTSTAAIQTGFPATTNTDKCQVCTRVSPNQQDCTTLSNCTPKPTTPPSTPSTRCITAHSYENNCATGDGIRVTLWDNGVEVCNVRKSLKQATNNADSIITMDCGNGRSVTMTDNGGILTYDAPDGSITLDAYDEYVDRHTDTCAIKYGSEYEYVFHNGKCRNCPRQELCNAVARCDKFDGRCS
jgi:hypothetical protein